MRAITIVDCEVVPVLTAVESLEQELARQTAEEWAAVGAILEAETERDLTDRLKRSIKATCKHPLSERHVREGTTPDTGESYRLRYCEACQDEWTEYDEAAA